MTLEGLLKLFVHDKMVYKANINVFCILTLHLVLLIRNSCTKFESNGQAFKNIVKITE